MTNLGQCQRQPRISHLLSGLHELCSLFSNPFEFQAKHWSPQHPLWWDNSDFLIEYHSSCAQHNKCSYGETAQASHYKVHVIREWLSNLTTFHVALGNEDCPWLHDLKKPKATPKNVLSIAISRSLLKLTEYSEYWRKRKVDNCNYLQSTRSWRKSEFTEELVHECFLYLH